MSDKKEPAAVTSSLLDKAIAYVSPEKALKRSEARTRLSIAATAHKGADMTRRSLISMNTTRGDADADNIRDLPTLRNNSRDFERNNPLALGAINTVTAKVVGTGLKLQSNIDRSVINMSDDQADILEATIEREFSLFADSQNCDAARTLTWPGHQELAFRQSLVNGDHIVTMPRIKRKGSPYSLALMHVEADRLSNEDGKPNTERLTAGVQKDEYGAPVKYHICNQHPGAIIRNRSTLTWTKVDAFGPETGLRNVIHLYKVTRAGQTRGVPYLAPVIETLKQLDKYTEAELMAAVVTSMLTVFVKTETGELDIDITNTEDETGAETTDDDIKLGSGTIVGLADGESIETVNPLRPNAGFDPFVMAILRQVGVALELPFEILIKHFTASYSASRAAIMEAWTFFKNRRAWLARHFCQEVYETWFFEAVAIGRISAPGFFADPVIRKAYTGATWIGDAPIQIDPVKEVKASENRIAVGISTVAEETAFLTGGDFEKKLPRIRKEVKIFEKIGIKHPAVAAAPKTTEDDKTDKTDIDDKGDLENE